MCSKVIIKGTRLDIAVLDEEGGSQCLEFIDNLPRCAERKMKARMNQLANIGMLRNDEVFKKVDDKIWEIKYGNARVYCFFDHGTVVCTHGAYKTKRKRTSVEIRRANALRSQYLAMKERRQKGQI